MEENNLYAFTPNDIVVWKGITCKFGYVSHLLDKDDSIRKATEEEVIEYRKHN